MSTKAETLGTQRGPMFGPREWTVILVVAALAVSALVMSVVALERDATGTSVAPRHAAAGGGAVERAYEGSNAVTGTGPGLAAVANASILRSIYERSQPVTGSGPGLTFVADRSIQAGIYQRSAPVTGTGPGLQHLPDDA